MYSFLKKIGKILNSKQSRSIMLTGNVYDLFYCKDKDDYVPLLNYILNAWKLSGSIIVSYDLNGSINFDSQAHKDSFRKMWIVWKTALDKNEISSKLNEKTVKEADNFLYELNDSIGKPTAALELLRQMSMCINNDFVRKNYPENLIIIIENTDMIIPESGDLSRTSDLDRRRISVCHDWLTDPVFMNGDSSVILLSESKSLLSKRISTLPQVIEVEVSSPDKEERRAFMDWFGKKYSDSKNLNINGSADKFANLTAGLSIHALRQIFIEAVYDDCEINIKSIVSKVEDFIKGQLGDDVIEFKKPSHTLEDIVGFGELKKFLKEEFIPRFKSSGEDCLSGAAVSGALGSGKSFLMEAVASELDMPVLVLKNLRSQWFGQTDVIFERLKRVLEALNKAVIFIDEADTQFGGISGNVHETEKRLTGKIQAMMSDPKLKGKILWLLMTARIHRLSPDIRRPGRAGDLIIPILDPEPESEDHKAFVKWMICGHNMDWQISRLISMTRGFSAASFASLRSEIKSKLKNKKIEVEDIKDILSVIDDHIPANIEKTRKYQTYQALINCTRKSLLPEKYRDNLEKHRSDWLAGIRELESELGKENC